MIMKGCEQWNSVSGWEDFASSGDRTRFSRSVGQRLTQWATGAPLDDETLLKQGLLEKPIFSFNPNALRKAKLGFSECNRVEI